ncbi:unnamed protein product [Pedinophyceae sp. YPF-701]|nr:unnamed protein product [Pedinophyceae sp. YPF-701]
MTEAEIQKMIDEINDKFVEARDEIEFAQEDAETTYFNESCEAAREITQEALDMFNALLSRLDDDERGKLQRSMGMKMEQLKAELEQLETMHD